MKKFHFRGYQHAVIIGLNLNYKMCILIIHPNNYSDIMSAAKNINHYEICLINRNHYMFVCCNANYVQ